MDESSAYIVTKNAGELRSKYLNCFLLFFCFLPVYWFALNSEDYHQWSARRSMVVEV